MIWSFSGHGFIRSILVIRIAVFPEFHHIRQPAVEPVAYTVNSGGLKGLIMPQSVYGVAVDPIGVYQHISGDSLVM